MRDRDLESRRIQERHDQLGDGIRTDLLEQLSKVDGQLSQYLGPPRAWRLGEEPPPSYFSVERNWNFGRAIRGELRCAPAL